MRIARCELAAETLIRELQELKKAFDESLSEPAPVAEAPALVTVAEVVREERKSGQRGPDKRKRVLSPEVRAARIATLVAARAELARKRAAAKADDADGEARRQLNA